MDKIWDRKSFDVGGHWPLWWGMKKTNDDAEPTKHTQKKHQHVWYHDTLLSYYMSQRHCQFLFYLFANIVYITTTSAKKMLKKDLNKQYLLSKSLDKSYETHYITAFIRNSKEPPPINFQWQIKISSSMLTSEWDLIRDLIGHLGIFFGKQKEKQKQNLHVGATY